MKLDDAVQRGFARVAVELKRLRDAVYLKPDDGIPREDLSAGVLAKLDGAVQEGDARLTDARTPTGHRHDATEIDNLPTGGGGAGIDDAVTALDSVWSSGKTATELSGKAQVNWWVDDGSGVLIDTGMPLNSAVTMVMMSFGEFVQFDPGAEIRPDARIPVVSELPEFPSPGRLYAVRDPETGQVAWHMPILG